MRNGKVAYMACAETTSRQECQVRAKFPTSGIQNIMDIEDLVQKGNDHQVCPYKAATHRAKRVNIVLAPYNTLFHAAAGKDQNLNLRDRIVIIDEAHSMFQRSEAHSIQLSKLKDCRIAVRLEICTYSAPSTVTTIYYYNELYACVCVFVAERSREKRCIQSISCVVETNFKFAE